MKSLAADMASGAWVLGSFETANGYGLTDLVHYAANGLPDPSFQLPTLTAATRTRLRGIKALPGGRLLLLGDGDLVVGNRTAFNMLVLRPNGRPDSTFNVLAYFSGGPNEQLRVAVAAQPDGKLLVGGAFSNFGGSNVGGLIRLLPNGQMDPSFVPPGNQLNRVRAIAVQPDGRILVGGDGLYINGIATPSGIIRLQANGNLDASFTPPPNLEVWELALQPDGRILVGGDATNQAAIGNRGSIVRLLASGLPDLSFTAISSPGRELVPYPTQFPDRLNNHFALQADGSLVVAFPPPDDDRTQPSLVRRYLPTGQPNASWSPGPGPDGEVKALVSLASGNILLGGTFGMYANLPGCLAAVQGSTGQLVASWRPRLGLPGSVTALARQPNGKLLIGGNFSTVNDWATANVARLWPNGDVDTTFRAPIGGITGAGTVQLHTLTLNATGQVLLGGEFATIGGQPRAGVARLLTNGDLDPTFQAPLQNASARLPSVRAIAVQPDGKMVLGGSFTATIAGSSLPAPSVVRVLSTGAIDADFLPAVPFSANIGNLLLRPGGEVLVSGNIYSSQLELMRQLRSDGTLDPAFQIVMADPVLAGAGLCIVPEAGVGFYWGAPSFALTINLRRT
ncbi:delta-60 repeat domain-containing protein [Hymenobacter volaticus]|uniref:Delta-60 repeat domain-containing protein n=1 Tax=Hymenobacter volaticus TaxID=2932254 RepID=A0ABY4G6V7_9BACT|nr:delta-60 repeat domain-containing protein [Hymenobacter volaticus]UOQ66629.1 delta-60 repeat domain-containing protein [Hymenobacter volaticus]